MVSLSTRTCARSPLNGLKLRGSSTTTLPCRTGQPQRGRRSTLWGADCQGPANHANSGSAAGLLAWPTPHEEEAMGFEDSPHVADVDRAAPAHRAADGRRRAATVAWPARDVQEACRP